MNDFTLLLYGQVARLQEQLQTERDLRAALEIGLSMSAAQLSGAQSLDSKVFMVQLKSCSKAFFLSILLDKRFMVCSLHDHASVSDSMAMFHL